MDITQASELAIGTKVHFNGLVEIELGNAREGVVTTKSRSFVQIAWGDGVMETYSFSQLGDISANA